MQTFLRKLKLYLLNKNYSQVHIRRTLRAASIFLCWYHGDIDKLENEHYHSFLRVLNRKNYEDQEIQKYHYALGLLYTLLHKKIIIEQKKLHRNDEASS